mmetsp:Transcript_9346/g.13972  ORF Transcript_9346/g.13972 Transcript_9346/m.13972 type:complete len:439 (-) Transcript_9346:76-1392(-)|eukprot:CAMPEP_0194088368 /NCGR_PEP_ID=MMETSP0149-20130528/28812_1 /TAXON_ID=122233 /ORGANISM="Chaetoceros debilis, Strain MM31A-1" /LENGTH=438 /DNA_ID=CAMNT_0038771999 /DNA_START=66 /DNA_END=1382 /DNA_ORIENTATION=+
MKPLKLLFSNKVKVEESMEEALQSSRNLKEMIMTMPMPMPIMPTYGIVLLALLGILILTILIIDLILLPKRRKMSEANQKELLKHAVITGGSSGIGLAMAKQLICTKKCQVITLLARNVKKLNDAQKELEEYADSIGIDKGSPTTTINIVSVDVADAEKIANVAKGLSTSVDKDAFPVPSMLFNVAGTSSAQTFVDTDYKEFDRLMSVNYLGSAYVTRAFLPYMVPVPTSDDKSDDKNDTKNAPKSPRAILFTSSQAGQCGVFGYTAYSASKFALRGFAEALQMEVGRDNVSVQVAFPPDTDTPGFETENIGKPEETMLISETSGLYEADDVAKKIVASALQSRPPFQIYFGLEGWMLSSLAAGMSPSPSIVDVLCQIFLSGILRFVSLFYLMDFRHIVAKVQKQRLAAGGDGNGNGMTDDHDGDGDKKKDGYQSISS